MTANAMAGDAGKYLEAGMDGYISNPIRKELLLAELEPFSRPANEIGKPPPAAGAAPVVDEELFNFAELLERVDNDRELMKELVAVDKKRPSYRDDLEELRRSALPSRPAVIFFWSRRSDPRPSNVFR